MSETTGSLAALSNRSRAFGNLLSTLKGGLARLLPLAWDFLKTFLFTILVIALMVVLGGLLGSLAQADTNLTAQCPTGTSSGSKTCAGGVVYRYPVTSAYTRTTGDVFYFWGVIGTNGMVSVCPVDIPVGSILCPAPVLIAKSAVPLAPPLSPTPTTFKVQVSWTPPTTGTQDGKTVTLKPEDIIGYQIAWVPEAGGRGGEIVTAAIETSRVIEIPRARALISVSVQGFEQWGASSQAKLADPDAGQTFGPLIPDAPLDVQVAVIR